MSSCWEAVHATSLRAPTHGVSPPRRASSFARSGWRGGGTAGATLLDVRAAETLRVIRVLGEGSGGVVVEAERRSDSSRREADASKDAATRSAFKILPVEPRRGGEHAGRIRRKGQERPFILDMDAVREASVIAEPWASHPNVLVPTRVFPCIWGKARALCFEMKLMHASLSDVLSPAGRRSVGGGREKKSEWSRGWGGRGGWERLWARAHAHRDREAFASEIAVGVAKALAHVHASGRVHCDVKPANVLVDARGRSVRLADFGICAPIPGARGHPAARRGRSHMRGSHMFTVGFVPPEVDAGCSAFGPETDAWGLGLVALQAMTGASLVSADDEAAGRAFGRAVLAAGGARWREKCKRAGFTSAAIQKVDKTARITPSAFLHRPFAERIGAQGASPEMVDFLRSCLSLAPSARAAPSRLLSHPWLRRADRRSERVPRAVRHVPQSVPPPGRASLQSALCWASVARRVVSWSSDEMRERGLAPQLAALSRMALVARAIRAIRAERDEHRRKTESRSGRAGEGEEEEEEEKEEERKEEEGEEEGRKGKGEQAKAVGRRETGKKEREEGRKKEEEAEVRMLKIEMSAAAALAVSSENAPAIDGRFVHEVIRCAGAPALAVSSCEATALAHPLGQAAMAGPTSAWVAQEIVAESRRRKAAKRTKGRTGDRRRPKTAPEKEQRPADALGDLAPEAALACLALDMWALTGRGSSKPRDAKEGNECEAGEGGKGGEVSGEPNRVTETSAGALVAAIELACAEGGEGGAERAVEEVSGAWAGIDGDATVLEWIVDRAEVAGRALRKFKDETRAVAAEMLAGGKQRARRAARRAEVACRAVGEAARAHRRRRHERGGEGEGGRKSREAGEGKGKGGRKAGKGKGGGFGKRDGDGGGDGELGRVRR